MLGSEESVQVTDAPQTESQGRHYQVRVDSENVPGLIETVMSRFSWLKTLSTLHGQRLEKTLPPSPGFSLRDINLRRFNTEVKENGVIRENTPIFEPVLGSTIIKGSLYSSNLAEFYTPDRVFYRSDGAVELRGPSYFVSLDSQRKDPLDKIQVLRKDLVEGMQAISIVKREDITDQKEFLMYLGVIDYLKNQSITLFNALTYPERGFHIPPEDPNNPNTGPELQQYYRLRHEAIELMTNFTRMYYQTCLGLPYDDSLNLKLLGRTADNLTSYLKQNVKIEEYYRFTYPEVNHPLVIILGAQEAALKNPKIDTLIGIPSGGTESAIAVQMAYELIYQNSPGLLFVPLSLHSIYHDKLTLQQLNLILKPHVDEHIMNKNILIVDDNSNTGSTLQMAADAVIDLGAVSEKAQLMQHDPQRILNKHSRQQFNYLFRIDHDNYSATMGVVRLNGSNIDLYKEMISQRLKKYYSSQR